jgi:asparagine synthase (glutamine-hydrolysing)
MICGSRVEERRTYLFAREPRKGIRMPSLLTDCMGFAGQRHFFSDVLPPRTSRKGGLTSHVSYERHDYLDQWLSSDVRTPISQPELVHHAALFLTGIVASSDPLPRLSERFVRALYHEKYTDLPIGDYCGCLVTKGDIWFWKTRASNTTIFYRRDDSCIRWSTDPRSLVGKQDLSRDALIQCCLGEDVFVYPGLASVSAGTIVRCSATSTQTISFDQIPPVRASHRVTLPELAVEARLALYDATRPLAESGAKIGLLLSGGIDSAAVAAALVSHGASIIAYHLRFGHPAADESGYAQTVCQALSLPLVTLPATTGSDYLSDQWRFPHPYGHGGLHWMQQIAEQAERDGITILMTGRGGDPAFGPLDSYGLADICSAPIAISEKVQMIAGAISTDWLLPDLVKSLGRSHSLINERSLSPDPKTQDIAPPFLCHLPTCNRRKAPYEHTSFSPHDLVLETTVWQPRGLHMLHPYHHGAVQHVASHIPAAYRLIPYRGMRVVKPVLRLAWTDLLPPLILRQKRGSWLSVPNQDYCINHRQELLTLLTDAHTRLCKLGILDAQAVRSVLSSHQLTRTYAKELIATAMTELFLRQIDDESSDDSSRRGA